MGQNMKTAETTMNKFLYFTDEEQKSNLLPFYIHDLLEMTHSYIPSLKKVPLPNT